nr:cation:proton antiporter [Iodidimonas nitroreducens]
MSANELAIVAAAVLLFGLFGKRLGGGLLTIPLVFSLFGFALGDAGLDLVTFEAMDGTILMIAELTLTLILFSDAARLDVKTLLKERQLAIRMLLIGMPVALVLGAGLAYWLFPGIGLLPAFLLAAMLVPTDAALGQPILNHPDIPLKTRQVMIAESGLNDGLALPAVVMLAIFARWLMPVGRGARRGVHQCTGWMGQPCRWPSLPASRSFWGRFLGGLWPLSGGGGLIGPSAAKRSMIKSKGSFCWLWRSYLMRWPNPWAAMAFWRRLRPGSPLAARCAIAVAL